MSNELLQVACPSCAGVNRIPRERLGENPRCGRCKDPLFARRPVELDESTFDAHLAAHGVPLVVDFWAPWCGPCRTMAPHFAEVAAMLEPQVRLAKLDTDRAQRVAGRYSIRGIPTTIVFRDGVEIGRRSGAMDARTLVAWIRGVLD